jgi:two-component system, chemotaxis family, protein-glutamate methylesterase/glutaminase
MIQAERVTAAGADLRPVMIVDGDAQRRRRIGGELGAIEAASLSDAFSLAEESNPCALLIAAEFARDPSFGGILRLSAMLQARCVLFVTRQDVNAATVPSEVHLPMLTLDGHQSWPELRGMLARPAAQDRPGPARQPDLVVIGASTGGVSALETVLSQFPADCPPTIIVQHIRDGFARSLAARLNMRCRPRILEAVDGTPVTRGTVVIASDSQRHLTVAGRTASRCRLIADAPRNGHRPSVDVLFESALGWGSGVSAALLTGMGVDGAAALGRLRAAGAYTIAQDQATSIVWGMPRAAAESGAASAVLPLDRIAASLLRPPLSAGLRPA